MSLAGKRIVNTRAAEQAAALDLLLRQRGALPLAYPCIAIAPPTDLDALGLSVGLIPEEFSADGLAQAFASAKGERVLLPHSEVARPALAQALAVQGAAVTSVKAYRMARESGGEALAPLLRARQVDAVTFTGSSALRFFAERLRDEGRSLEHLSGVCIACICAQTRHSAEEIGLSVAVQANQHTLIGVVDAPGSYFTAYVER